MHILSCKGSIAYMCENIKDRCWRNIISILNYINFLIYFYFSLVFGMLKKFEDIDFFCKIKDRWLLGANV